MSAIHEKAFEDEISEHLAAHGWLYSPTSTGYDKERALFPEDVFAWLEETQPAELAKVVKPSMSASEQQKAKDQLLDRLVKTLDLPLEAGGGTLNVLRKGFKKTPAAFMMCQFRPNTTHNASTLAAYEAVRVRVMRQVYYLTKHTNSIDLVLFVNGLPVATLELKTDNVQSIDDAIAQYRHHRDPRGEPLLGFGNRCLVHFAVSNDQVAMTTRLRGKQTLFLPFNRGNDGAAGNPLNLNGAATSYLWERVLQRDSWLHILGKLLHVETRTRIDPISGEASKTTTLLFPRYHQWELVTRLLETVRDEGPGHKYLAMHSAGSGKTNSIAWTAHGLATLHNENNQKVFDTVIVVTDRTVLDDQLQKAIKQIEGRDGTVAMINPDEVRKAGTAGITSKSGLLAKELLAGRLIVIVTMQTFPFALHAIRKDKGLASKRFAIIADEAHSSQTGEASRKLRSVLTAEEIADLDDGGEIDTEAMLAAEMEARAESPNLSFFAFTATPKAKTLELFGSKDGDGLPRPFHVYSMQQAIEEGYILDVLKNYTTYDTAFKIAQKSTSSHLAEVKMVDESQATRGLMRWVSLHPTNIAQKVQIIVEHYRTNVRHLLDGHAKAMVVTASREHAVRYKEAIDAYIAKQGYQLGTLVAFSGSIDVDGVMFGETQPPYTEINLNPRLRGRTIPVAFGTDEFSILIVANKFQTGFDQPLLSAMYVDKRLAGVAAVQTLSRLNRTYPAGGKDTTFVLDFVNDPDEILDAFRSYYREASIEETTDPDSVHDLQAKLDAASIYTDAEIEAFTLAYLTGKHGAITAPLKSAGDRFTSRYQAALADGDTSEIDTLDLFRKDVGTFVRLYDFLSQIVNYADTGLEKRSLFLRLLQTRLTGRTETDVIDLSTVELTHIKQARSGEQTLDLASGEAKPLTPMTAAGSGTAHDPNMVRLEEVLNKINDLFADEDFSRAEQQSWVEGLVTVLTDNDTIREQAEANTKKQFVESPDLSDAVTDAVLSNQTSHNQMATTVLGDDTKLGQLVKILGELVHENLRASA